jgi:hypothetical protein
MGQITPDLSLVELLFHSILAYLLSLTSVSGNIYCFFILFLCFLLFFSSYLGFTLISFSIFSFISISLEPLFAKCYPHCNYSFGPSLIFFIPVTLLLFT